MLILQTIESLLSPNHLTQWVLGEGGAFWASLYETTRPGHQSYPFRRPHINSPTTNSAASGYCDKTHVFYTVTKYIISRLDF